MGVTHWKTHDGMSQLSRGYTVVGYMKRKCILGSVNLKHRQPATFSSLTFAVTLRYVVSTTITSDIFEFWNLGAMVCIIFF